MYEILIAASFFLYVKTFDLALNFLKELEVCVEIDDSLSEIFVRYVGLLIWKKFKMSIRKNYT